MGSKIYQTADPIKDIQKIKEMKQVLKRGQNGFRNLLLFEIGLSTALRISDILKLTKANVSNGYIRIKTSKTGVNKLLELHPSVYRMLEMHIDGKGENEPIFDIGRVMAWKLMKKAADEVGLDHISTHSLRKTAAWHFYHNSGKDIALTMNLLGHKSPKETMAYLGITTEEVNSLLRRSHLGGTV